MGLIQGNNPNISSLVIRFSKNILIILCESQFNYNCKYASSLWIWENSVSCWVTNWVPSIAHLYNICSLRLSWKILYKVWRKKENLGTYKITNNKGYRLQNLVHYIQVWLCNHQNCLDPFQFHIRFIITQKFNKEEYELYR